ncbi:hypothetical protein GWC77_14475 [Paraburkholderia sp. NMBU_R16]|jgi:hypothetical protein|uniref:hypothetical protein n=1 Tax=Paraburkholderia sp. NMBU_R16 TaxID=2698676 RepID=UPI0015661CBC|nr:hypothetical protein [Paraburkholderia sp. NMBU_R16]NRO97129.1 hypothetical protein [Paraburkholderia sp. NMBU_R16]
MEKWIVLGSIWIMTVFCLTLFVRGASPAMNRAMAIARVRTARLAAEQAQQAQREGEARQDAQRI